MTRLSPEHTEYAVTLLERVVHIRGLSQKWLEERSNIPQSEISRIKGKQKTPTKKELEQLFEALGIRLSDVIHSVESLPDTLLVYVATPLTGITKDKKKDTALRDFVARIEVLSKNQKFDQPDFRFYWPGSKTHPQDHANVPAKEVYITDRSRASGNNLIVMLCAAPSYGVGQENEIGTQAGVPAIRLVPEGTSRMMMGSFLQAWNITYTGSLETGIHFTETEFVAALQEVRKLYFAQQALFRGLTAFEFGPRLERLVDDRFASKVDFAAKLGVNPDYVDTLFVEPPVVSNPSAILMLRMARLLGVTVGHLLGETTVDNAAFTASMLSLNKWVSETEGLDAQKVQIMKGEWAQEYDLNREPNVTSHRNAQKPMLQSDWNELYMQKFLKKSANDARGTNGKLFQ